MPQTRGKISWSTNSRVQLPQKRLRTGNLNSRLENISLKDELKKGSSSILNQKYRSQADRDYEITEMRQDAEKLFFQVKMTKELGGKWVDMVRSKSSFDTTYTSDNNTDINNKNPSSNNNKLPVVNQEEMLSRSKSAISRVNFSVEHTVEKPTDKPRKATRSAAASASNKSRKNSISTNIESYTRSYKYLRDLVHFDSLTRDKFQRIHDRKIADAKHRNSQLGEELDKKIQSFLRGVDDFVDKSSHSREVVGFQASNNSFIKTLEMPDFDILNK